MPASSYLRIGCSVADVGREAMHFYPKWRGYGVAVWTCPNWPPYIARRWTAQVGLPRIKPSTKMWLADRACDSAPILPCILLQLCWSDRLVAILAHLLEWTRPPNGTALSHRRSTRSMTVAHVLMHSWRASSFRHNEQCRQLVPTRPMNCMVWNMECLNCLFPTRSTLP